MLRKNVGIFTERGGTIGFLLTKEGAVVIDSQFPDTSPHLIDEINKQSTSPIKYLLNTHHHGDHTSGNIAFKGITDQVVSHSKLSHQHEERGRETKECRQTIISQPNMG
jgi:cyclase